MILLFTLSPEPRKLMGGIGIQLGTDEQDILKPQGSGFRVSGFRVSGFRVSGFRVSGFRVSGFRV